MPVTVLTIANIRDRAREDLKIDPGKNIWSDAQLERWANEGVNILRTASDLKVSLEELDMTLVAATALPSTTFPTDYRKLLYAKLIDTTATSTQADETPITIITDTLVDFKSSHDMQAQGTPECVYEQDGLVYVYPLPTIADAAKYKVRIGYTDYSDDLASSASPDFPAKWHYIIEFYVKYRALGAIPGKSQEAQLALQEWEKWCRIALADILFRQNESLEFRMPALPFKRRK